MLLGLSLVIIIRLLVPLSLFKSPFLGVILSMLADSSDIIIFDLLKTGIQGETYNLIDKALDMYFLIVMGMVVYLTWINYYSQKMALILLVYRFIGFVLYEITGWRWLMLAFPNSFEFFFIYVELYQYVGWSLPITNWRTAILVVVAVSAPKLAQEYILHIAQWPVYGWFVVPIIKIFRS